jgi:hypothetical protein
MAPLALAALVLWGCSSIPGKNAPEESLVVIKTEFINPLNLTRGYEMAFNYSGGYPASWVGQYSWDFNALVVREPGVMLKTVSPRIQAGMEGKGNDLPVDFTLPYEPGRIAVADFVFVQDIRKVGENSSRIYWSFRTIKPQEKEDLVQALKADDRFASWMREDE